MRKKDIYTILKKFQSIQPDADFAQKLRTELLSRQQPQKPFVEIPLARLMNVRSTHAYSTRMSYVQQPFNAFAFALTGILIVVGVYTITQELSPLFLPGLNQKRITAEAEMVGKQIDIQLSQIEYFKTTTQKSASALKEVTEPTLDHLNETLLKNESQSLVDADSQQNLNEQVQDLLQVVQK